jgi:hypothetical protein
MWRNAEMALARAKAAGAGQVELFGASDEAPEGGPAELFGAGDDTGTGEPEQAPAEAAASQQSGAA